MDTLKDLKIKEFRQSLQNLKAAAGLEYSDISRDSTLLRFELVSEIAWKVLKIYLEEKFQIQSVYPTEIYREAGKARVMSMEDVECALEMVHDRNRMVHDYNQNWSEELYKKIVTNHIPLFEKISLAVLKE